MSSYQRFISYMYNCSHGQGQKNCGFLKIEIRNDRCVIYFQLNNAPCLKKCNVYLCFRQHDPVYIFLQSVPIQNGNVQYKLLTQVSHIAGGTLSFSQCSGILCTDETGNSCFTCWDEPGMLPPYSPSTSPASGITRSDPPTPPITTSDDSSSTPVIISNDPEPSPALKITSDSVTESNPKETPDTPVNFQDPRPFSEIWSHMQEEFPSMNPFDDNSVIECIKITPSDLGYLPTPELHLTANQFLQHGYKIHHHLLMGRLRGQLKYIIGIPGIYDPQEQFMAKTFGFSCFKPLQEYKQKNGQFGYWLRCFRQPTCV